MNDIVLTDEESKETYKGWTSGDLAYVIADMTKYGRTDERDFKRFVNEMNRRSGISERLS